MRIKFIFGVILLALVLASCCSTKYVPQDKYLLNKVRFKSDVKGIGAEELKPYLRQKPNPGILGKFRLQLKMYSLSGRDTTKWRNRVLRRIGEPPVIYSSELTDQSREQMQKYLANKGYINAQVKVTTSLRKKRANVVYSIKGNTPYYVRNIHYDIEDDSIRSFILGDTINSTISEGSLFDVDLLEAERQRLVRLLRRAGFYYFNKDYLYVKADTALNSNEVDITLKSRPMLQTRTDGTIERAPHKRMKINSVSFIPWYNPQKKMREQIADTVYYGGYIFFYDQHRQLRPSVLAEKTYILPNYYYDERDVERTYAALNTLSTTKYINIIFREVGADLLDCYILMSPTKLQNFSVEVEGNNTDGDIGAAVNGTYQHRNLFKGAEQLSLKARTAYQSMGELSNMLSTNSVDLSTEAALSFPKFMFPFLSHSIRQRVRASTELSASYNYQTNPWYSRTIVNSGLKYVWVTGSLNNERYSINLIEVSYVYLPHISDEFKTNYLNTSSILKYSYEDHFIMSTGFSFSHNNKNPNLLLRNYFSYWGGMETGGNLLSAICSLTNTPKEDGAYRIGNIRYAQYAKGEFDYSFNNILDTRNKVIYHTHIGLAYPYGNADVVPFEKRFYAGGANSVRGWSMWSLGPGIYKSTVSGTDFAQIGDLKLDLNLEYRFKLFWVMEGAAFFDGGNVWTIRAYDTQEGGLFKFDSFYKQLAYSYGIGLRFNFSFFLFRIDMGVKLYDPSETGRDCWQYPIHNNDLAYHFAIGYPF